MRVDLSFVIPALDERENLEVLIPGLRKVVGGLGLTHEIIVIDGGSRDGTPAVASDLGARVISQETRGYGDAIRLGVHAAEGEYVLTLDADLSHAPAVVIDLWSARSQSEIVIASRYVRGGAAKMSLLRTILSRALNVVFARGLSLGVHDLSSGCRLYPRHVFTTLHSRGEDFDVLPEILVRAYAAGWRVVEVPFRYEPRASGHSKARLVRLGKAYMVTFARLWRLRNSIQAADYDERAFDSVIPLQRAWQRRRHAIVMARTDSSGAPMLDVGCGSSRIIRDRPQAIGVDVRIDKLRYMSRYGLRLVAASIFDLPFHDASFNTIICSEVIEHVSAGLRPLQELARVQRTGGRLILGTPDYGRWSWRAIEACYRVLTPGGYADEHITQYRHDDLVALVENLGYRHLETDYVFGSEMILTFVKT